MRQFERRIDKHAQVLIVPELTWDGQTTSLPAEFRARDIIGPCAGHGSHEEFHCQSKIGLDLTRLPSGKFDTNFSVCQHAAYAMNILRLAPYRTRFALMISLFSARTLLSCRAICSRRVCC